MSIAACGAGLAPDAADTSAAAARKMGGATQAATQLAAVVASTSNVLPLPGDDVMKKLGESIISSAANAKVITTAPGAATGTIFYVDPSGSDSNNGTSQSTPWQTIQKVNARTYSPGDMILFKAGGSWELSVALHPLGSGSAAAPIVIGAYGTGAKPKLSAKNIAQPWTATDGTTHYASDALYLENQQYYEIRDLDISSKPDGYTGTAAETAKLFDRRGIHIVGGNNTTQTILQGFSLHDLYVHDVAGEWQSVSGTGWDPSKRTAGILFEIIVKGANGLPVVANPVDVTGYQPTWFSNVTIEKNVLVNNSFGGIIIKQLAAWGVRQDASGPDYDVTGWYPNTNITIQNNYLDHNGSDWAADTIYLTCSKDSVIRHNVSSGAGTSGIELYYTDNITVEWNEVYGAKQKPTGSDSNAIDTDKATTNALVQYNYLHDNGDGILLCGFLYGSSVYRYNVIKDTDPGKRYMNIHGDKGNNYIYNNVFYNSSSSASTFVNSSGGSAYLADSNNFEYFYNNIFYSPNATSTVADGTSVTYDNNSYYGVATVPAEDTHAIIGDPQFMNVLAVIGGAGNTVNLNGFKLKAASPLIGAGKVITAHPSTNIAVAPMVDLEGKSVVGASTDVGAYVVQPDIINMTVSDTANAADWAIKRNVQVGNALYGDRTLTITTLPSLYLGGDWIRTANDSKAYTGTTLVTFTVTRNSTVYIASDDRITTKPAWLAAWTATTDKLTETEGTVVRAYTIYKKEFAANALVSLGAGGSTSYNNYAVIVKPLIANMLVSDTANAASWSALSAIQVGDTLFGDRSVTVNSLPAAYVGADWIRTANASKSYTGATLLTFSVTRNSTVYVAIDDRITTLPAWLSTWTSTPDKLIDNEAGTTRQFSIYQKSYTAHSQVSLGNTGSTTYNNYTVMVK
nr:right-handed parallel beta-helix repeat-containing protein [Duganella margarita]